MKQGLAALFLVLVTSRRRVSEAMPRWLLQIALGYGCSDEGCHPRVFMVIPDRFRANQLFKFTVRISRTTPFAFSSRATFARLTIAASPSAAV
jgi:hypothetical protein